MPDMNAKHSQSGQRGLERRREPEPAPSRLTPGELFTMNPFSLMRRMSEEMDRVFGGVSGWGGGSQAGGGLGSWAPPIEVSEWEGNLIVSAELPGLNKEDVTVEVTDDALVIQGERRQEQQESRGRYHRTERSYGQFYRLIPLPEGVNAENAKARFNNGVLEITVPMPEPKVNRRQITVEPDAGAGSSGSQGQGERPASSGSSQA